VKDVAAPALEEPVKVRCWGLDKDESFDDGYVDARTPKKVQLPLGALGWSGCLDQTKDGAQTAPSGSCPRSPAPCMPPALPTSLQAEDAAPPAPSSVAHSPTVALSLEEALTTASVQDEMLPGSVAAPPRSPPPSMPPALPASLPVSPTPSAPAVLPTPKQLALPTAAMRWERYSEATPDQPWLVGETPGSSKAKVELSKLLTWSAGEDSSQEEEDAAVGHASRRSRRSELLPDASPTGSLGSWFPPGLVPPGGSPSHGSALHGTGRCRPCAWFWKGQGCQNAFECGHCHLCPEGEIKARKKAKRTIMRMGLATPKVVAGAELQPIRALSTVFQQEALVPSEPESTATPASDQGSTAGGQGSEQDLAGGSELGSPRGEAYVTKSLSDNSTDLPPGLQMGVGMGVASIGSMLHGTGSCRPCAWFWKPVGCQSGSSCNYCHVCPAGAVKARKKCKQAIMRMVVTSPMGAGPLGYQGAYGCLSPVGIQ